jgi:hypothetical protein
MEAEDLIRWWLINDTTVAGLNGRRVFPVKVPQNVPQRPAITYRRLSGDPTRILAGNGRSGQVRPRIELGIRDTDYDRMRSVARAIIGTKASPKLDGFRGNMGPEGGQVFVQRVSLEEGSEQDDYIQLPDGSDQGEYVRFLTFEVVHSEV